MCFFMNILNKKDLGVTVQNVSPFEAYNSFSLNPECRVRDAKQIVLFSIFYDSITFRQKLLNI